MAETDAKDGDAMSRFGLVAFVKARIDEDKAEADKVYGIWREHDGNIADVSYAAYLVVGPCGRPIDDDTRAHILRHDPARALREVEAKRARLALLDEAVDEMDRLLADDNAKKIDQGAAIGRKEAALTAVRHDAAVYSDHPDYRDDWKP